MINNSIAPSRTRTRDTIDPTRITGRVYVASSLSTYDTPRYDRMIDAVRLHFPEADLLPARDQFTSNADWRRKWPRMLPTLAAVVFFDDGDGYLGLGVSTEIVHAHRSGLPVWFLDDAETLHPIDSGTFSEFPGFDPEPPDNGSDIRLFPYLANPRSADIDPKRCVLVGFVESYTGAGGFAALCARLSSAPTLASDAPRHPAILAYHGHAGKRGV